VKARTLPDLDPTPIFDPGEKQRVGPGLGTKTEPSPNEASEANTRPPEPPGSSFPSSAISPGANGSTKGACDDQGNALQATGKRRVTVEVARLGWIHRGVPRWAGRG
jgi:hypothetical protein